jgi:iron-sulfur cluster assembly protein
MAISLSENAQAHIKTLLGAPGASGDGLRIKVVGGGCSGLQYKMDLDAKRDGDKVFGDPSAQVLVDRKSFLYLNGTVLEYHQELMKSGFSLENPNVSRTCGCGASFAV